ncbi:D-xylulose kinase [Coprinopsis cinerea okayama7|uniref:D-xylulose kinase n=1 Tax=Coprinopsis cinerea (strain Okayama-7 / 130 / ATCC MYA-4618 / FGSC 9003) TaxID=240176 RepID=A8P220_COPC7|nr:D-xylulose kinase [Coprinopsis cinerea okayama7\|eukprot:XP_001838224.1 D-xylulose kinase [Coprinopsis cinerea okayama7\
MPAAPKSGPALFLGIELATDQLRASIVDESLELVGVEAVDFDSELPEYQTHGGIFTTPGEAYTTPVEMWIKGFDLLLEKLHRNHDLTRIKAIGGAAQHALVWWKSTTIPSLSSLDPHTPFHQHFPASSFSLPNTPTASDTSSHSHALAIESLLGGPDHMASRVGMSATASMVSAQLMRVRESWPVEVWGRTGRVQLASAFIGSLITGKWMAMSESEACATGMWVHGANPNNTHSSNQGYWDEDILEIVAGSREDGRRVRGWLGEVDTTGGARRVGNVSRYLVERYGFDPDTIVSSFTSDYLSTYLSLCPSPNDAVLEFGPMDTLLTPAQHYIPTRLYNLFPHPAQEAGEKRRYIAALSSRNGDVPRALVRDMYTKSWSAFDRLVAIVPPGGSIGLDDKLFSFWHLQGDSYPFSRVKGIYRFETGIKVNEFRDLRANPRCLLESQLLSFRVKWSRLLSTGVLGTRKSGRNQTPPVPARSAATLTSLGLPFDPYDHTVLPSRVIATGAAANFPSVSNLVGDIFNAPVFVPNTQVDSAQISPHRNAPAQGYPSRPALGGAYVARWVWGREWGMGGLAVFEDEIRRLLGKRWVSTGGMPLRTNINGPPNVPMALTPGSGANSGASTPFGHPGPRSTLGATVFVEEDEDEEIERERNGRAGQSLTPGHAYPNAVSYMDAGSSRLRPATSNDTLQTSTSVGQTSTAFTTPDLSLSNLGVAANGTTVTPATPTPLAPVTALPTSDAEAQIGLAKVAESDVDAFLTYAAIVPEYCRLENILIKGIV